MHDMQNNKIPYNVINYNNIPAEMKAYPNWVLWRLEDRGGAKPAKVPYSVHGGTAKVNDPKTWGTFDEALQAYQQGGYDGMGYVLEGTPYVVIDIDNCFDEHGNLSKMAKDALNLTNSYTEISPSSCGLHAIMKGTLPPGARRNTQTGFEMYGHGSPRYLTMTGNLGGGAPLPIRADQAVIDETHTRFIDIKHDPDPAAAALAVPNDITEDEIEGDAAKGSIPDEDYLTIGLRQDATLIGLYNGNRPHGNESADDLALCNKLGYWCDANKELMKQTFLNSPHYAQKDFAHKQKCQREDYIRDTIQEAIAGLSSTARADDIAYQQQQQSISDSIEHDDSNDVFFEPLIPFEVPDDSLTPDFPVDILPTLLRQIVEAISECLQIDAAMPAVALICFLSLASQKTFIVKIKEQWLQPVNLYCAIVARPGSKKSIVFKFLMEPIRSYVEQENTKRESEVAEYQEKCKLNG